MHFGPRGHYSGAVDHMGIEHTMRESMSLASDACAPVQIRETGGTTLGPLALVGAVSLSACGGGGGSKPPTPQPDRSVQGLQCASLTAAAAAAALTACGGGVQPFEAMTESRAARLLNQGGLGATPEEVAALVRDGGDAWFDAQLALPVADSPWEWARSRGYDNASFARGDYGLDQALWRHLCIAPDVLRQRVVLALSEVFVVSPLNMVAYWKQFACLAWWELLEQHCFGNFRDLLTHITLSPAMGVYLSMRGSAKADASGRRPDENYARELLQLFTIGLNELNFNGSAIQPAVDAYTQDTVTELAKVFTGWDVDGFNPLQPEGDFSYFRRPMDFHSDRHTDDEISVPALGLAIGAGTSGPDALRLALDAIFMHHNVGPFIARLLIQRLVTSNPSEGYVSRVAQVFNVSGLQQNVRGDLAQVIRAVLSDPEARPELNLPALNSSLPAQPTEQHGKLREPMLRFLQWLRLTQISSTDGQWNFPDTAGSDKLGQAPLRSPSVFNFFRPGYVPPHSGAASAGLVAPEFQITNESTVMGYVNFLLAVMPSGGNGLVPNYDRWLALANDVPTLVDQLNLCLSGRTLSADTLATVQAGASAVLGSSVNQRRDRVVTAFLLIMCCPEYLVQR